MKSRSTAGSTSREVLIYTAGEDIELDLSLVSVDCLGTAAHVTMLAKLPIRPRIFSQHERGKVISELVRVMRQARQGAFRITLKDQDVHMAVERVLTQRLGNLGKRIHTARSRNDQVAVDLRLYAKEQLLDAMEEVLILSDSLLGFAGRNRAVPMVGRTHMQPAMPGSVGLWAFAYAEGLLDDLVLLQGAYEINDQCPLGSAAGYGVPLPIDRQLVSDLLGFRRPQHNVLAAGNARGKVESIVLSAMSQVMLTLSRLAQDLIIFSMPELNYFTLPVETCTGSSIMPQKTNPDVLELVRAKSASVMACAFNVMAIIKGLPGGYSRDLQETKKPFFEGIQSTRASLRILTPLLKGLKVNRVALLAGFIPAVFATDYALELVAKGMPFRDAYFVIKDHIQELKKKDPHQALRIKKHLGAPSGLDFGLMQNRVSAGKKFVRNQMRHYYRTIARLLRVSYPFK